MSTDEEGDDEDEEEADSEEADDEEWDPSLATPAVGRRRRARSDNQEATVRRSWPQLTYTAAASAAIGGNIATVQCSHTHVPLASIARTTAGGWMRRASA